LLAVPWPSAHGGTDQATATLKFDGRMPWWLGRIDRGAGMHAGDVSAAYAAGLTCRPIDETIAATWQWIQAEGYPTAPPGRPAPGLDPAKERRVLDSLAG
jgi:hypothetical protein